MPRWRLAARLTTTSTDAAPLRRPPAATPFALVVVVVVVVVFVARTPFALLAIVVVARTALALLAIFVVAPTALALLAIVVVAPTALALLVGTATLLVIALGSIGTPLVPGPKALDSLFCLDFLRILFINTAVLLLSLHLCGVLVLSSDVVTACSWRIVRLVVHFVVDGCAETHGVMVW